MSLSEVNNCLTSISEAIYYFDSVHHQGYIIVETFQPDSTIFDLLYGVVSEVEDSISTVIWLRLHDRIDKGSINSIAAFKGICFELKILWFRLVGDCLLDDAAFLAEEILELVVFELVLLCYSRVCCGAPHTRPHPEDSLALSPCSVAPQGLVNGEVFWKSIRCAIVIGVLKEGIVLCEVLIVVVQMAYATKLVSICC